MTESAHPKPATGKGLVVKRKPTVTELPTESDPRNAGAPGLALRAGSTHRSNEHHRSNKGSKTKSVGERSVFLAMQGGGAKGIVHVGGLTALDDMNLDIKGVAGTSAGSIVAALVAVGYKGKDLLNLDGDGNLFEKLPSKSKVRKPTDLFTFWGWQALRLSRLIVAAGGGLLSVESRLLSCLFRSKKPGAIARGLRQFFRWFSTATKVVFCGYIVNKGVEWVAVQNAATLKTTMWIAIGVVVTFGLVVWKALKGITTVDKVRKFIDNALRIKITMLKDSRKGVTFADLQRAKKPPLKIVATNVYGETLELFCVERTPDVAIADAVAASICLPVIFKPWRLQFERHNTHPPTPVETTFLDGGLVSNLPAWPFDQERKDNPDIPTIALSIGEPPVPTHKHWLFSLVGSVVNGSQEVHTRAAGQMSQVALSTTLGMLDFDKSVLVLRSEAKKARQTTRRTIMLDLTLSPLVLRAFTAMVQRDIKKLTAGTLAWAHPVKADARVRVSLAVEQSGSFVTSYTAGHKPGDKDAASLGVKVKSHIAQYCWNKKASYSKIFTPATSAKALAERQIWGDASFIICIPLYPKAHLCPKSQPETAPQQPRGCVLVIESNIPVITTTEAQKIAFSKFLETVQKHVLYLDQGVDKNNKRATADFVQEI
ncbi:patatin-like phospholipase family protein [Pseudomonas sp. DWRC2-2]|uniref:patatin-like phospholipase family protein n=1 Tax=Pseudomonas sp. DWRC2-2 TaxID=2804567 RepID=UPI003CF71213